jgi:hypothetical protein
VNYQSSLKVQTKESTWNNVSKDENSQLKIVYKLFEILVNKINPAVLIERSVYNYLR